jgi:ABC-2 type transport system permease protein
LGLSKEMKTVKNQQFLKDKKKTIWQFIAVIVCAVLLNIIGTKWHKKIDVTDDNRFTLSAPTKNMLKGLKENVNIRILLTGKLPANYTKLQQGAIDILNAFKDASNGKVNFIFENPIDGVTSVDDKLKISEELRKQGITPKQLTNQIDEEEGDGVQQRFIFPYAQVLANGKQDNVALREEHYQMEENEILNYSESVLEYKFANCIKQLYKPAKEMIAYISGNGEAFNYNTMHAMYLLGKAYDLDTVDINYNIEIPAAYKCIVICKPIKAFDEKAKFKIDQYVMNGGRVLWFLDGNSCSLDSMETQPNYAAFSYDLNLDDMLMKYGVRLKSDVIEDIQCNELPLRVGETGNSPDIRPLPWVYFPILTPTNSHPVVKNLDAISAKFASTLDTITNTDNKKTVLLSTSTYSRSMALPFTVSFNSVRFKPKTTLYNKKHLPVAVAIEGGFSSLYENRIAETFIHVYEDSLGKKLKGHTAASNKMIVISDADIMMNDFSKKNGPTELGFYSPTGKYYGNQSFLMNCMEYLTDDNNLLEARSKDVQLRTLDLKRVKQNKTMIQILNIALPIAIVIFLGSAYFFFRKKKYAKSFV